jgi:hypothetical protein
MSPFSFASLSSSLVCSQQAFGQQEHNKVRQEKGQLISEAKDLQIL